MDLKEYYENLCKELADVILSEDLKLTPDEEDTLVNKIMKNIDHEVKSFESMILISCCMPEVKILSRGRPRNYNLSMLYKACKKRIKLLDDAKAKREELAYERMIGKLNLV